MAVNAYPYEPPNFPESQLSPEATRTRRNLIAVFAIWSLVVLLDLKPTAFTPLGIEFKKWNVPITTFASYSLIFFWVSFAIYAYKDWTRWWHVGKGMLDEKKALIKNLTIFTSEVSASILQAQAEGKGDNDQVQIKLSRNRGSKSTSPLLGWKQNLLEENNRIRLLRKQFRQLRTDIYARSSWDYLLPGLMVLGPIWHLWVS